MKHNCGLSSVRLINSWALGQTNNNKGLLQMSKNTKIVLGIIGGMIALCICICVGGWIALKISGKVLQETMVQDTPEEAAATAKEIIDYKLPLGYQEQMAMNMGFMQMITIADSQSTDTENSRPIIMIASMSPNIEADEEEMRLQIQLSMQRSSNRQGYEMKLVEEKEVTIRGQQVSLMVYEGTDENGNPMKQIVSGLFDGKNSKVMLFIMGQESNWNQEEIDSFILSIK